MHVRNERKSPMRERRNSGVERERKKATFQQAQILLPSKQNVLAAVDMADGAELGLIYSLDCFTAFCNENQFPSLRC